ncbi:MAG: alpha/beta hydrolase [Simplicispira suum]|uniref:lipase family alpha/beta hydrolase n=1 Tax=Simplicispira suum TaxID=2109915 RepID=UPI001C6B02ED|nr:alpha/beta hydrolase [Simplicispira suum]MBW7833737.1 alpha/beta hydrolase [Simplicispira suum]
MTAPSATPKGKAARAASAAAAAVRQLRATDARGVARLATLATAGVTDITEGVHRSVLGSMGLPGGKAAGRTRGLTGLVYQAIRAATRLVDAGLQAALLRLEPFLDRSSEADTATPPPEREAVLAALNGVMGDRLAADGNPLALPMELRQQGRRIDLAALGASGQATGKVLLLVHGLCMNDLQWQRAGHDHGAHLAQALGYTPVYVRYNTGLHASTNGRELAGHIEALLADWPVPVQEFTVLVHSMGGLVMRSACQQAAEGGQSWLGRLHKLVFLGTPHHGAPLERAGNWVDVILGSTPWSRPFARLGQLRSAGITDLRYGHVQDADWQGHDRFRRSPDTRQPLPLPAGVACYAVAATLARQRSPVAERLLGDGLVPLASALGQHARAEHSLIFDKDRQWVVYGVGHMQLLDSPRVAQQLVQWLAN